MDLAPGEAQEFVLEVCEEAKTVLVEVLWNCEGCEHAHSLVRKCYLDNPKPNVTVACPCCTPLWMKIWNWLR